MPDLLAGTTILAGDTPPTQHTRDTTTVTGQGVGDTDWEELSPEVSVTFTACTTGRAEITVWAGLRVSASTGRAQADMEVREDDASGAVVHTPTSNPLISAQDDAYEYGEGSQTISGLIPGATYFTRVMTRASTSATEYDVAARSITVKPAT